MVDHNTSGSKSIWDQVSEETGLPKSAFTFEHVPGLDQASNADLDLLYSKVVEEKARRVVDSQKPTFPILTEFPIGETKDSNHDWLNAWMQQHEIQFSEGFRNSFSRVALEIILVIEMQESGDVFAQAIRRGSQTHYINPPVKLN